MIEWYFCLIERFIWVRNENNGRPFKKNIFQALSPYYQLYQGIKHKKTALSKRR